MQEASSELITVAMIFFFIYLFRVFLLYPKQFEDDVRVSTENKGSRLLSSELFYS